VTNGLFLFISYCLVGCLVFGCFMEEKDFSLDLDIGRETGVNKDIQNYTDILGKQIFIINQLLSFGNKANVSSVENSINVLEANLSPYLPVDYVNEINVLEYETFAKLRRIKPEKRIHEESSVLFNFLLNKYSVLLRFAKEQGFLPKKLKWE
jgi:hypothetical protein